MANLFDPANSPTVEPIEIVVGDYLQWRREDLGVDYPNTLYTATYIARVSGGGATEFTIVGSAYNNDYIFNVTSEDSALFVPGYYHWQLEILRNSDNNRIVVVVLCVCCCCC